MCRVVVVEGEGAFFCGVPFWVLGNMVTLLLPNKVKSRRTGLVEKIKIKLFQIKINIIILITSKKS